MSEENKKKIPNKLKNKYQRFGQTIATKKLRARGEIKINKEMA
jgi:hypothetical protein